MKTNINLLLSIILGTSAMAMDQDSAEQTPPLLTRQLQSVDILDIPLTNTMTPKEIKEIGYTAFKYYESFLKLENDRSQTTSVATKEINKKISRLTKEHYEIQTSISQLQSTITDYEKLIEKSRTYLPGVNKINDIIFGVTWYPEGLTEDKYPKSFIPMDQHQVATSHAFQLSYDAHFKLPGFRENKEKEFQQKVDDNRLKIKKLEKEMTEINLALTAFKLVQEESILENNQQHFLLPISDLKTIVFLKNIFRNIANPAISIITTPKEGANEKILSSIETDNIIQIQKAIIASDNLREVMKKVNAKEIREIYEYTQQYN